MIALRESGISIYTVNSYLRGLNSFFTWLAENDHCEKVRMKRLTDKAATFLSSEDMFEHSLYSMVATAIDMGCPIDARKPLLFQWPSFG